MRYAETVLKYLLLCYKYNVFIARFPVGYIMKGYNVIVVVVGVPFLLLFLFLFFLLNYGCMTT